MASRNKRQKFNSNPFLPNYNPQQIQRDYFQEQQFEPREFIRQESHMFDNEHSQQFSRSREDLHMSNFLYSEPGSSFDNYAEDYQPVPYHKQDPNRNLQRSGFSALYGQHAGLSSNVSDRYMSYPEERCDVPTFFGGGSNMHDGNSEEFRESFQASISNPGYQEQQFGKHVLYRKESRRSGNDISLNNSDFGSSPMQFIPSKNHLMNIYASKNDMDFRSMPSAGKQYGTNLLKRKRQQKQFLAPKGPTNSNVMSASKIKSRIFWSRKKQRPSIGNKLPVQSTKGTSENTLVKKDNLPPRRVRKGKCGRCGISFEGSKVPIDHYSENRHVIITKLTMRVKKLEFLLRQFEEKQKQQASSTESEVNLQLVKENGEEKTKDQPASSSVSKATPASVSETSAAPAITPSANKSKLTPLPRRYCCDDCGVFEVSERHYKEHLGSKRHKYMLQGIYIPSKKKFKRKKVTPVNPSETQNSGSKSKNVSSAKDLEAPVTQIVGPKSENASQEVDTDLQVVDFIDLTVPQVVNTVDLTAPQVVNTVDLTAPQVVDTVDLTASQVVDTVDLTAPQMVDTVDLTSSQVAPVSATTTTTLAVDMNVDIPESCAVKSITLNVDQDASETKVTESSTECMAELNGKGESDIPEVKSEMP